MSYTVFCIYGLKHIAQSANKAQLATHTAYFCFTFSIVIIPLHPTDKLIYNLHEVKDTYQASLKYALVATKFYGDGALQNSIYRC